MDQPDPPERNWRFVRFMVAVLGIILVAVVPNPPQSLFDWGVLAAGALVIALITVNELDRLPTQLAVLGDRFRFRPVRSPARRKKAMLTIVLTVVLAPVIGLGVPRLLELTEGVWLGYSGCPHPIDLAALSSPEGLASARTLAAQYERWTATGNHDCPAVSVYVYAASTADTREALAAGWATTHLRDVGPRPDLWLVDSGTEVDKLRATATHRTFISEDSPVASSPLVLGLTGTRGAEATEAPGSGRQNAQSMTWAEWLRRVADVVRPDPDTSPVGEVATAVLYGIEQPVDGARARAIEQQLSRSLDQDGYPLGNSLELLCRHRQLTTPRSAVIVSEEALVRFNTGAPLGGNCATAQWPGPEGGGLQAVYPADTRSIDYRFVRFSWAHPDQEREAAAFGRWLAGTDEGKKALVEAGLRPPGFAVSEPLSEQNGVSPGAIIDPAPIGPGARETAMELHALAHRPGRVLLVLDSSGSMAAPVDPARSRFEVAGQGARGVLALMGERDELGVRLVPGGAAVPIGPRDDLVDGVPRREALVTALDRTTPQGSTPMVRAIADSVLEVGPSSDEQASALVVLTGGDDTPSRRTPEQVRDAALDQEVRIFVVAVGETSCASRTLQVLTEGTGGACHDADFASVEDTLVQVFDGLWKGP